jgi:multimeric flavodoxin WrbA
LFKLRLKCSILIDIKELFLALIRKGELHMKVIALNGSPKQKGNTYNALYTVCEELNKEGIDTEIIHIGNMDIKGCISCGRCREGFCIHSDDEFKRIVEKIYAADGLLLGSPVYYAGIAGTMKCFLDRLFYASGGRLRLKAGASIAVSRRAGGTSTFDQLNHYLLISEMITVPSYYWNGVFGGAPGEVLNDEEGMSVLYNLARNMAWVLKMIDATRDTVPSPMPYPRKWMNFIR